MLDRIRIMGIRLGMEVFIRQSMLERENDRDRLDAISCPTLIIGAAEDQLRSMDETKEHLECYSESGTENHTS